MSLLSKCILSDKWTVLSFIEYASVVSSLKTTIGTTRKGATDAIANYEGIRITDTANIVPAWCPRPRIWKSGFPDSGVLSMRGRRRLVSIDSRYPERRMQNRHMDISQTSDGSFELQHSTPITRGSLVIATQINIWRFRAATDRDCQVRTTLIYAHSSPVDASLDTRRSFRLVSRLGRRRIWKERALPWASAGC
jgi:hypothetical protein